ncbi:DUF4234 domain-containing protein [bacterium]|nr:DUF4234 domain-containing protein [bacterium]
MQNLADLESKKEKYVSSIAKDIILTVLTCGICGIFWQFRQIRAMNYLLGKEKYSPKKWLLLAIITCGIYHFFHEYMMAQSINEVQLQIGKPVSQNLPVLSVILTFFGGGIVTDAIQQLEINKFFEKG